MKKKVTWNFSLKKEAKGLKREIQKLEHLIGGIVSMKRPPAALFIIDSRNEYIAVREARNLGIPIVSSCRYEL